MVQPDASGPLDRFQGWLTEGGLDLTVVRPYAGDAMPRKLAEDGLLVLGGDMDSWDDEGFPWLADIRTLLLDADGQHKPTLGICLGAQLLALAHGGAVGRGAHGREAGVVEVRRRPGEDALLDGLPATFPMATLHGDAITRLPDRGVWLADGAPYPHQAFRVGATSWGVQFHPEVSPVSFASWGAGRPAEDAVRAHDEEIVAAARALAGAFARTVFAPTGTTDAPEPERPR